MKNIFKIFVAIVVTFLAVFCQKENDFFDNEVESCISTSDGVKNTTVTPINSGVDIVNVRDWVELGYNPSFAMHYVKLFCHTTGLVEYKKLDCVNPFGLFRMHKLDVTFTNSALYSYRYFVREFPYSNCLKKLTENGDTFATLNVPYIGNDYPWPNASPSSADTWGFYKRWCTSWVAWKVNQMWGTYNTFNNRMFGSPLSNARYWKQKFIDNGYSVDQNPRAGDIIWYQPQSDTSMGHVAFVHSVDNGTIHYSYYSENGDHKYHTGSTSNTSDKYFIHVQQKLD